MLLRVPAHRVLLGNLAALLTCGCAAGTTPSIVPADAEAPPGAAASEYRLYITNESSDVVSRVAFSARKGAWVEREIPVGVMPADTDGPHGVAVSPDGKYWYVTLAHGAPDGRLWRFRAGVDTLEARTTLGRFPASLGTSPDGRFVFVVNFNLHGDMEPSDLSVVHAPTLTELTRITSCLMPHGSRTDLAGTFHYHVCMHSDQLVAVDLATLVIATRFSLLPGRERRLDQHESGTGPARHREDGPGAAAGTSATCSPTWVVPGKADGTNRLVYVACNGSDQVLEVDTESWWVERRWDTDAGPYNLDVSPDGRYLVVTLKGAGGVAFIDLARDGEPVVRDTTRPVTHGVVVSPDSRYAFVTNESVGSVRGTMDVFELESLNRVASVELQHQPGGIDLWRVDPGGEGPTPERR